MTGAMEQIAERLRQILNADDLAFGIRYGAGGCKIIAEGGGDKAVLSVDAARKVHEAILPIWGDDCAEVILLGGFIEAADRRPNANLNEGGRG